MRLSSSQTWVIVGIAGAIWFAFSLLGITATGDFGVVFELADLVPLGLAFVAAIERWGWRWQPLHRLGLVNTPVVIGTWRGQLVSFWEDEAAQRPAPKTVYLTLRQTATTVRVRLLTDESASEQVAGIITTTDSGYPAISYTFRNEPDLEQRHTKSQMHYGAGLLRIQGTPANELAGHYWTDRKSSGTYSFAEHSLTVAQSYGEAAELTYGPAKPAGPFTYLLR